MAPANGYLVLDIETIPDERVWLRPESRDTPDQRSSFPPSYAHQIIVVGGLWLTEDYMPQRLDVIGAGRDESGILESLSEFMERNHPALVTYNGRAFDLPVIALRSLHHGLQLPWYYQDTNVRHRYSEDGHIDLCDWLADHGATRSGSLDALARLIGLPGKLGVDGSQVAGMHANGQLEQIENYCLADVAQTALLFLRFRLLQGVLDRDGYRRVAAAITRTLEADPRLASLMAAIDADRLLDAA